MHLAKRNRKDRRSHLTAGSYRPRFSPGSLRDARQRPALHRFRVRGRGYLSGLRWGV